MTRQRLLIGAGVSTFGGALMGVITLIALNAALLSIPLPIDWKSRAGSRKSQGEPAADGSKDYKAITERNLFRARLQAEIPKPKSDKEIEEEILASILTPMTLKGVMTGSPNNKDFFAVIDRGGQKGVWTYEIGETIERGLTISEIRKDAVIIERDDFAAVLKLFARSFERIPGRRPPPPAKETPKGAEPTVVKKSQPAPVTDYSKDIKKEGKTTMVSKSLAEKIRRDNTIMSSVAIKISADSSGKPNGYKVVSVDNGSLAQKLGIQADDVVQEVNGHRLKTAADTKNAQEALKNASKFDVKVLRQGKVETLRYEIR